MLLKPHVDLLNDEKPVGRFWRGDIGGCPATDWNPPPEGVVPFTAAEWTAWFASYTEFFMPYVQMAAAERVEMLSMNCELYCANREQQHWRQLVQQVRQVYRGKLTVSQIDGHEQALLWWDAVDIIGIDAYYSTPGHTAAEMVYSWQTPQKIARGLHQKYGKPILYTEIGMCSGGCRRDRIPTAADLAWHATKYEAVFEAFRGESYFLGSFWWNWDTDPGTSLLDDCLTPQGKPAEDVLRKYYRATEPKPTTLRQPICIGQGRCTC